MANLTPGHIVRERREALGLTREQLASDVGVSTSMITRLELQDRLPNAQSLAFLAARLDLSVDVILSPLRAQAVSA